LEDDKEGAMERRDIVKMKGSLLTLLGGEIKEGDIAKDFSGLNNNLEKVSLSDFKQKIKLIASVPSLDTPVCDTEIKHFNDEAAKLSKDIIIIFISMDLPFAQKRFCQMNDINKVKTLSDHRDADFGLKYGVLIKELRLLARAVFIIDRENRVRYIQVVPELSSPPDYNAALTTLKKIIG
jgi:thiol peroxidase